MVAAARARRSAGAAKRAGRQHGLVGASRAPHGREPLPPQARRPLQAARQLAQHVGHRRCGDDGFLHRAMGRVYARRTGLRVDDGGHEGVE